MGRACGKRSSKQGARTFAARGAVGLHSRRRPRKPIDSANGRTSIISRGPERELQEHRVALRRSDPRNYRRSGVGQLRWTGTSV